MKKIIQVNIGCGKDIKKDFINVDYIKGPGVDIVHNLNNTPYPFNNKSIDLLHASHVLEHLSTDWFVLMREFYRIIKPGGYLMVKVPHFSSPIAHEPFHIKMFRYTSFDSGTTSLDQQSVFKIVKRDIRFPPEYMFMNFINSSERLSKIYEWTFLKSLFPAEEIMFILKKQ